VDDLPDGRDVPWHDLSLRRAVSAGDVFGGWSGRPGPGASDADHVVLRVRVPGVASAAELDLDVAPDGLRVMVRSAQYKLSVPLPRRVRPDGGSAKFNRDAAELRVEMPVAGDGGAEEALAAMGGSAGLERVAAEVGIDLSALGFGRGGGLRLRRHQPRPRLRFRRPRNMNLSREQ